MTKKEDWGPAPICVECGGRTRHYLTMPKTHDRPRLIIYRCDHCGTVATAVAPVARKE